MSYHELSVGVGGLVRNAQGQVLLIERVKQPGVWTLPSGYLEPGETMYQTLQRELQEEANIIIRPYGVIGLRQRQSQHEGNNFWILLRANYINGEPKADMMEVSRVSFFDLSDALSKNLTPVTRHVLSIEQNGQLLELLLQSDINKENYLFFC